MQSRFFEQHWNDENGNPGGGTSWGNGFAVSWQNGPLGRCTCPQSVREMSRGKVHDASCERKEPNGAFVEDIIAVAIGRIAYYQNSRFACDENADAFALLSDALAILNERTARREAAATEGTHEGT